MEGTKQYYINKGWTSGPHLFLAAHAFRAWAMFVNGIEFAIAVVMSRFVTALPACTPFTTSTVA